MTGAYVLFDRTGLPEVRPGYRKYPSGAHVVFYKVTEGGVDVVRILHERMDFGLHL